MKLFLTSNGLTNPTLTQEFEELVNKEPQDITVNFIPTAANPRQDDQRSLVHIPLRQMENRGYRVNHVELQHHDRPSFEAVLRAADVIFVGGGNSFYLSYWMQRSGLVELLPELLETRVYAGISAGSIIAGRTLGLSSQALDNAAAFNAKDYAAFGPAGQVDGKTLALADLVIRPHLHKRYFNTDNIGVLRDKAKQIPYPVYALDDDSALRVVDATVRVVGEGSVQIYNQL